jgi:hypothetical protein
VLCVDTLVEERACSHVMSLDRGQTACCVLCVDTLVESVSAVMSCHLIVDRQRGAIRFPLEQRGLGHWQRPKLLGSHPAKTLARGRQVTQWFRTRLVTVSKVVWVFIETDDHQRETS